MSNTSEKFIIEFDSPPALVFVQRNFDGKFDVYQDGKKLNGIVAMTIDARIGEPTKHTITFATGFTDVDSTILSKIR